MPIQYNQTMVTPVQPPAYVRIIAAGDFIQEMCIFSEGAVMVIRMGNESGCIPEESEASWMGKNDHVTSRNNT